jgi:hypothetical protein
MSILAAFTLEETSDIYISAQPVEGKKFIQMIEHAALLISK